MVGLSRERPNPVTRGKLDISSSHVWARFLLFFPTRKELYRILPDVLCRFRQEKKKQFRNYAY
jgi:hypothetical protein